MRPHIFEGFMDEDLSVAHTDKPIWKIEEDNVKIEKICSLTAMIKVLKEGREVGGDNVKKISSDILEMKRERWKEKKKTKN